MKIADIQKYPVGYRFGGCSFTVKTTKKTWQLADKTWIHQVVLMDETGEMYADVKIGKYNPLVRGQEIRLVVCEIQKDEKQGTKIYVCQFEKATAIGEPPRAMDFPGGEPLNVVRGKIKCWLAAAKVQAGATIEQQYEYVRDPMLAKIIDEIMNG